VRNLRGSDIKWSNPYGDQITHFIGCIKSPNVEKIYCNHKKIVTSLNARPIIFVSSANERKTQIGLADVVGQKAQR
jgi:hypothetical protein